MGLYDAIVIQDSEGVLVATINRPSGPLENGSFDSDGNWHPDRQQEKQIDVSGFGIDPDGHPYYDPVLVDPDDRASLWINPLSIQVWLTPDV